ncbi:MAG: hypothetical protein ACO1RX_20855 [Candidatus Sericytochromatia bacterium]
MSNPIVPKSVVPQPVPSTPLHPQGVQPLTPSETTPPPVKTETPVPSDQVASSRQLTSSETLAQIQTEVLQTPSEKMSSLAKSLGLVKLEAPLQTSEIPLPPQGPVTSTRYVPEGKTAMGEQLDGKRLQTRQGENTQQTHLREQRDELVRERDDMALRKGRSPQAQRELLKRIQVLDEQIAAYTAPNKSEMLDRFAKGEGNIFRTIYDRAVGQHGTDGEHSLWQQVKSTLIGSEEHQATFHMGALTDLRKQYVDNLVKEVINQVVAELPDGELKRDVQSQLKSQAFGSTNLTSDYDVIIGALSQNVVQFESRIVEGFNARFGKAFGVEGGEFFDTNVYTRGLAPNTREELGSKDQNGLRVGGTGPYKWQDPAAQKLHERQQDVMSLVKQRKFMTPESWGDYTETLVSKLPTEQQDEARSRYAQADKIYTTADQELKNQMASLKKDPQYSHLEGGALELAASNRLYETKLKAVNLAYENRDGVSPDMLKARVSFAMSQALLFANEPYFSEGTLRHVVGNEQELGKESVKLQLSAPQGLQSLNENLGDTLKDLGHHRDEPLTDIVIQSSKYIGRFCRAIDETLKVLPSSGPQPEALQQVLTTSKALNTAMIELQKIRGGSPLPPGETDRVSYANKLLTQAFAPQPVPTDGPALEKALLSMAQIVNAYVRPEVNPLLK